MNIQIALNNIRESGLTDKAIGSIVHIPQPTVSRLRRGLHKKTSYDRTLAIFNLAKSINPELFGNQDD